MWIRALPTWHAVRFVPRRNALACLLALTGTLCWWGLWSIIFRLSTRRSHFERARRAAFAAGRSLDSLRAGRRSMWLFRAAGRIAFSARTLLLRLTPDAP